jgi:hypothetical protein
MFHQSTAEATQQYVQATDASGNTVWLLDNRRPSLYTGNYGDCSGLGLINVTRFDAAYYKDNMTVLFHLGGNTQLLNEAVMSKGNLFFFF